MSKWKYFLTKKNTSLYVLEKDSKDKGSTKIDIFNMYANAEKSSGAKNICH